MMHSKLKFQSTLNKENRKTSVTTVKVASFDQRLQVTREIKISNLAGIAL